MHVAGWLGARRLVVGDGCCDDGLIAIVSATAPSSESRWKVFSGDSSTTALGTIGADAVLVGVNHPTGLHAYKVTTARPRGELVASIKGEDLDLRAYVDVFVAKTRANPWVISNKRYPYKGPGKVGGAFL